MTTKNFISTYCFIIALSLLLLVSNAFSQTCTSNPGTISSDIDITDIEWAEDGGPTGACQAAIDAGDITANLVIDMANGNVLTVSDDLKVTGDFLITGGPSSGLTVDGTGATLLEITGDLGDNTNNGVIYTVPDAADSVYAAGTVFGKNNNAFNGNGGIGGGTLDVKLNTTCGSPCPVTNNFDSCGDGGDDFCEDNNVVLPIILGNFGSIISEKQVELEWETISEENFDFFSVERSDDGKEFYEIGTVPGHGNSNSRIQYSFVDENPLFGMSYYRLNAIDYDGSFEKFQALVVEYIPKDLKVSVYPNPGSGQNLRLRLGLPKEARLKRVSIYDLSGERLFEKTIDVGKNELNLPQHLRSGFYFAKVQIDNYSTTKKLIIK